ncbi:MAG: lipoprotein [Deltaproteobacteria bacterium]|nr:lipoprotein [Candidatus Tharpella sp.]
MKKYLILLLTVFLLTACTTKDVKVKTLADIPQFKRVAVLPFDVSDCQSCGDSFPTCRPVGNRIICDKINSKIGYDLALSLAREIAIYGKYEVVEPQAAARIMPYVGQVPMKEIGQRLGVDVLVFGNVKRFQERIGGPMTAKKPASVYFEVSMIDARNGQKVWYAIFDRTQKSLSDDITNIRNFVRGGGKWLTAREFAEIGIAETIEQFPGLKNAGDL